MGNRAGWAVLAGVLAAALAGCSGDDEDAESGGWDSCEIDAEGCTCVIRQGGSAQEFPPADDCSGFDCCLLSRGATSASCSCFDTTESCEDVAASSGKTVVAQCPPPGELLSSRAMCVPEGRACPNRASDERSGCCEGLLCLSNGEDPAELTCQPLGNRDPEQAFLCEDATLSGHDEVSVVSGSVATSRGDLRFEQAAFGTANVGPGGCLNELTMELRGAGASSSGPDAGHSACELLIDAGLRDGQWEIRRVLAALDGCEGLTGSESAEFDVRAPAEIPFSFSYTGNGCGARDVEGEHCVVGTFEWRFTGELGGITFEGSRVSAEGVICGSTDDETCEEVSTGDAGR